MRVTGSYQAVQLAVAGSQFALGDESLDDFVRKGVETNPEMFCLLEFVRFEYCSADVMNDFFDLLWENSYEIKASMWDGVCARIVLPNINTSKGPAKQFPASVKRGKTNDWWTGQVVAINVPDGIIAHLTRECGGNVHDRHAVDITSGSFEKETCGANPHSGAYDNLLRYAAKNAFDLETDSPFLSAYRDEEGVIPHTRNNWLCYDFKERRIVPSHYTIAQMSMIQALTL
jgi:hypothetical protein